MAQPKIFGVSIDLTKNELLNAVIQNLAAHPANPLQGQIYYNTVDQIMYGRTNTAWVNMFGEGGAAYTHPEATNGAQTPDLAGARVLATFETDAEGHVDVLTTRLLTLADLGYTPYVHPAGADLSGPLTGPAIISDVVTDAEGHIVGFATRNLTAADIGAAIINDAVTNTTDTWSSQKIVNEIAAAVAGVTSEPNILGYDAATNTPNLDTAPGAGTIAKGDIFHVTVAGDFYGEAVEVGDTLIAKITDPASLSDWIRLEKNITLNSATDATEGIVRLATQQEVLDGAGAGVVTATTLEAKIVGLGLLRKISANIGDGASTLFTVTHNLNSQDVIAMIKEVATNAEIITEITTPTVNTLGVGFNVAPTVDSYRVTIIG